MRLVTSVIVLNVTATLLSTPLRAQAPAPSPPAPKSPSPTPAGSAAANDASTKSTPSDSDEMDTRNGRWLILGSGYGELAKTGDAQAAFSVGAAFVAGVRRVVQVTISKGSLETIKSQADFARLLLSPATSKVSGSLLIDDRPVRVAERNLFGIYGYLHLGLGTVQAALDSAKPTVFTAKDVVALAIGIGPSFGVRATDNTNTNVVTVSARAGFAARFISGDAYGDHDFILAALGRDQSAFYGGEIQGTIQINGVSVSLTYPILFGAVPGLTHGQLLPSATIGGTLALSELK